jgi:membrane protein implicated in regulation of membrane protease activity
METRQLALVIIVVGTLMIGAGLLLLAGGLSWFGRLPGDIRIERENTRVYIPITSMLLVSVLLSLALYVVRRFF